MKKLLAILAMICLIMGGTIGGTLLLQEEQAASQSRTSEPEKLENPAPPNVEALETLGLEPFVSELPVLMVDTRSQQIFKDTSIWVDVAVLDDPSGHNNILGGADAVCTAAIKYRGASSYSGFDKRQYRLKFYQEEGGKALDYDLFGIGADSEWVLNGPFLDRTLLRNYLVYNLAEEIMDWAPSCAFCELFIDGAYQGVYLAVEPITDGASRLRLSRFGLLSGATPYIIKRDRVGTEVNVLHTYGETMGHTGNQLSVSYPGQSKLTQAQYKWIESDVSAFEEALYSDYFDDPDIGYAKYIDVDSFVDYYIINEFALNHDGGILSTYAYKELTGKLQLCVWDFNNAFDNYPWFDMEPDEFHMEDNYWFDRLLQDRGFVERVEARYRELREGALSDDHIWQVLNTGRALLGDAVGRNFSLWGYTFQYDMLSVEKGKPPRDPHSYEEAICQLENVIRTRLDYMDNNIGVLYDLCIN